MSDTPFKFIPGQVVTAPFYGRGVRGVVVECRLSVSKASYLIERPSGIRFLADETDIVSQPTNQVLSFQQQSQLSLT